MSRNNKIYKQKEIEIELYLRDCKILKRELDYILADFAFIKNGGQIVYAVDFSEIHSYVYLNLENKDINETQDFEFILFPESSIENAITKEKLLENRNLNKIFFQLDKLVLLAPYATELESFLINFYHRSKKKIDHIHGENKDIIRSDAYKNFDSIRNFLDQPDSKDLIELLEKCKYQNKQLSERDIEWVISVLEEHGNSLLAILEIQNDKPIDRLKNLFKKYCFVDLEDVVQSEVELDQHTVDRRLEALYNHRVSKTTYNNFKPHKAASRLDSVGIATVEKTNCILSKSNKNIKLLLISRSKNMHEVLEKEFNNKLTQNSVLRHPKIFNILFKLIRQDNCDSEFHKLVNIYRTNESLLELLPSITEINESSNKDEILNKIHKIKEYWNSSAALEASLESNYDQNNINFYQNKSIARNNKYEKIRPLLHSLLISIQSKADFRKYLEDRIRKLTFDWKNEQLVLNLIFTRLDPIKDKLSKKRLQNNDRIKHYEYFFQSENSKNILNNLNSIEDIINQHDLLIEEEYCSYENILVVAIAYSEFNYWSGAELLCSQAIDIAKSQNDNPCEGYFFLAVCLRKWTPDTSDILIEQTKKHSARIFQAIEYLDRAIELKRKIDPNPDPRYLLEKSIQILRLNTDQDIDHKSSSDQVYSSKYAFEMLKVAEGLKPDLDFKIRIYNNILFYYTEKKSLYRKLDSTDLASAKKYYRKLKSVLEGTGIPYLG